MVLIKILQKLRGEFMLIKNSIFKGLIVILALLLAANFGFAQDEAAETAEKLMIWQLEAIKDGDYQRFIEHGNKAFKELMDEYSAEGSKNSKRLQVRISWYHKKNRYARAFVEDIHQW